MRFIYFVLSWSEGIPTKSWKENLSTCLRKLRKDKIINETFYKILLNLSVSGISLRAGDLSEED